MHYYTITQYNLLLKNLYIEQNKIFTLIKNVYAIRWTTDIYNSAHILYIQKKNSILKDVCSIVTYIDMKVDSLYRPHLSLRAFNLILLLHYLIHSYVHAAYTQATIKQVIVRFYWPALHIKKTSKYSMQYLR